MGLNSNYRNINYRETEFSNNFNKLRKLSFTSLLFHSRGDSKCFIMQQCNTKVFHHTNWVQHLKTGVGNQFASSWSTLDNDKEPTEW